MRIPKRVNTAIDWIGKRLGWPRVNIFAAATCITAAAGFAHGLGVAATVWTVLVTVTLIAVMWWRTAEITRLIDLGDEQDREIGRLRQQNNELMRGQLSEAVQMTTKLPGIKEDGR